MNQIELKHKIADIIRKDVEYTFQDVTKIKVKYTERGALEAADQILALFEPNEESIHRAARTGRSARLDFLSKIPDLRRESIEASEDVGLKAALEDMKCA